MSHQSTMSRAGWNAGSEPTQLSLPIQGRDPVVDRMEQQFDQLLDLLAASQVAAEPAVAKRKTSDAQKSSVLPSGANAEPHADHVCAQNALELSVVMPCRDEAETIGNCVLKALYSLDKLGVTGEVVVADYGSRDDSVDIAEALGARIVHVDEIGYGAALIAGITAARGKFVVIGNADESYDFTCVPKFYERLCEGADLVQGCRLPAGGGRIMPGAMRSLHRWGNAVLTSVVRKMFRAPINDVYCGMRGFRKDFYERLDQRCTGSEFAAEMIVKSALFGARISEVPVTFYKDGCSVHRQRSHAFRDGWRTLRFYMLQSPRWTFLAPGVVLGTLASIGAALALLNVNLVGIEFGAHTLLVSTVALLIAAQLGSAAILAKTFASAEGLLPRDNRLEKLARDFTLERCLTAAGVLICGGLSVVIWKTLQWAGSGFSSMDHASTMKCLIPAMGAVALGVQTAASSFLLSVLRMARR